MIHKALSYINTQYIYIYIYLRNVYPWLIQLISLQIQNNCDYANIYSVNFNIVLSINIVNNCTAQSDRIDFQQ